MSQKITITTKIQKETGAIDKVEYAKGKNIDFIICDHHRPSKEIPKAIAVLNPLREDCQYPYKELCGCGIGFKLIQGPPISLMPIQGPPIVLKETLLLT